MISLKSKGISIVILHEITDLFLSTLRSLSTRTQALSARPWKNNIWIFPPRFPTLHQFLMVHRNDKSRIAKVFFFNLLLPYHISSTVLALEISREKAHAYINLTF